MMHWMVLPSQNSFLEALPLIVMVGRGGVLGRQLGLDEVLMVGPPRMGLASLEGRETRVLSPDHCPLWPYVQCLRNAVS